jgi:hypothetical protein
LTPVSRRDIKGEALGWRLAILRAKIVDAESREQPKPAVKFSLDFFFEMVYFTG